MATRVKSERRVAKATELAATRPRDPVTKKWLPAVPKDAGTSSAATPAAVPPSSPPPPSRGESAPAPSPFRGRLRARLRQRSES